MNTHLCIRGVKQALWDLQPLSPEVTVVAIRQLIVHSGHLSSNPEQKRTLTFECRNEAEALVQRCRAPKSYLQLHLKKK